MLHCSESDEVLCLCNYIHVCLRFSWLPKWGGFRRPWNCFTHKLGGTRNDKSRKSVFFK